MRKNRLGVDNMERLSEKDGTGLRRSYCLVSQVVGWLVLAMGLVGLAINIFESIEAIASGHSPEMTAGLSRFLERSWAPSMTIGLILLFVSEVVSHLYGPGDGRSLLLRYGHVVLYVFFLLMLYRTTVATVLFFVEPGGTLGTRTIWFLPSLLFNAARLLIFIGMILLLKRMRTHRPDPNTVRLTL
jgi:hypothetical protein